jgi:hypothetical protein
MRKSHYWGAQLFVSFFTWYHLLLDAPRKFLTYASVKATILGSGSASKVVEAGHKFVSYIKWGKWLKTQHEIYYRMIFTPYMVVVL